MQLQYGRTGGVRGEKWCLVNTSFSGMTFLHELCFSNHHSASKLDHIDRDFINDTAAMKRCSQVSQKAWGGDFKDTEGFELELGHV